MATKTVEEQIADLQKRQAQLKAREQKLKAKMKEQERKKRTKRLIEIGAAVESVLGEPIPKERLPLLIDFLTKQDERGDFFTNAMRQKTEKDEE